MGPTDLALLALSYIRPSGPATNEATIALASAPQLRQIASDITASVQECFELCPSLYRREFGFVLAAPKTITLTLTQGSQIVTTADAFVEGSTVNVGGLWNEIFTEANVKKLLIPHTGTTGAQSCTLYGDVAILSGVSQLLDQVWISEGYRLIGCTNRTDLLRSPRQQNDYGDGYYPTASMIPTVGTPRRYMVENTMLLDAVSNNRVISQRLRVMPLPNDQTRINVRATLASPTFTVADLGNDATPSSRTFNLPANQEDRLLRPIFLERWFRSPWMRDAVDREAVINEARSARGAVASFKNQQRQPMRFCAPV